MPADTFLMTKAGLEKLKLELQQLELEKRGRAKERIKRARSFCDFREDSEYEAALKELSAVDERISTVKYMIQQPELIEKKKSTHAEHGSTISFKEIPGGELETYTIVGVEEADPTSGNISYESPIAKSLLGKAVHDVVTVQTPSGNRKVEIVSIS